MTNPVVEVQALSVAYRLYARPSDQLKELILGGMRHDTFWALRDVTLSIAEGERLGVVGPNGAGKSTLLKVIAGTLVPTSGTCKTRGRISSLLSMVPAWNGEDSGIENVRFNLLLNGVPQAKIPSMVEDIAEFTELGPFLYHPVKTYSTGMGARLSFAIATAMAPDILVIDEVLGTGDGYFAWKAGKRMEEFCARGRAVIIVSHSLAAIQSMCERTIWMQNGGVRKDGPTAGVLASYELDFRRSEDETMRQSHGGTARANSVNVDELTDKGSIRVRLVPKIKGPFHSTHYVRSVKVANGGKPPIATALEPEAGVQPVRLEFFTSEWGRLYEKEGISCRLLTRLPGRNHGGQILIQRQASDQQNCRVEIEFFSDDPREELMLELLDMSNGAWSAVQHGEVQRIGGWRKLSANVMVNEQADDVVDLVRQDVRSRSKPDVELLSVTVVREGVEVASIVEGEAFEIIVDVKFHRTPELADVGIKLTRMDGVYTFWQSSGMADANLVRPSGGRRLRFLFNPNNLGAGEFSVNAHVCNGWSFPDNYPHSQVFARLVNATVFRIVAKNRGLDMGVLNQLVPVAIESLDTCAEESKGDAHVVS